MTDLTGIADLATRRRIGCAFDTGLSFRLRVHLRRNSIHSSSGRYGQDCALYRPEWRRRSRSRGQRSDGLSLEYRLRNGREDGAQNGSALPDGLGVLLQCEQWRLVLSGHWGC